MRISEYRERKYASSSYSAQDLETKPNKLDEVDLDMVPMSVELEEEADGLEEYTFPKFAATYFQGSSTHTHIRRQLRHPLLYHDDKDNVLVSCSFLLLNLLPPQPWLLQLPSSLGLLTSGTALGTRDFRAKQIVLNISMKAVVTITIFLGLCSQALHTDNCPTQDLQSPLVCLKRELWGLF